MKLRIVYDSYLKRFYIQKKTFFFFWRPTELTLKYQRLEGYEEYSYYGFLTSKEADRFIAEWRTQEEHIAADRKDRNARNRIKEVSVVDI